MYKTISKRIELLNQTTLNSLLESSHLKIIENFIESGLTILGADFGFAWWKTNESDNYELVYKSDGVPYKPKFPREKGGNYLASKNKTPFFVESVLKENYEKGYDVSPYMKSYVIIPVIYKNYLYGSLVLCFKDEHVFSDEEKGLAVSLGNSAAQTITIHGFIEKSQNALADSERNEAYFKALVENSHEVIMLVDNSGKILYVSQSAVNIYKIGVQDMVGKNFVDFIDEKDALTITKYLKNVLLHPNEVYVEEFSYSHPDGSVCIYESTAVNKLDNSNINGVVLNIRDVTSQKKVETIKDLERLIQEEKEKTEFIANATHEIRTPLAIIRGNVDLALMKEGDSLMDRQTRSIFKAINHEIEHLSEMISDLAILTSNEGDLKSRIAFKEINLSNIIKHTVETFNVVASKKDIKISVKKIPNIFLMGNEAYLEKLFSNLVINAINYGKKGGWVKFDFIDKTNFIEVRVSDNGVGIKEEDLPYVFKRFYRSDKSHSTESKNVGLGLAIVEWIVSAHKGVVGVESVEGKGTTFSVSLPILK